MTTQRQEDEGRGGTMARPLREQKAVQAIVAGGVAVVSLLAPVVHWFYDLRTPAPPAVIRPLDETTPPRRANDGNADDPEYRVLTNEGQQGAFGDEWQEEAFGDEWQEGAISDEWQEAAAANELAYKMLMNHDEPADEVPWAITLKLISSIKSALTFDEIGALLHRPRPELLVRAEAIFKESVQGDLLDWRNSRT